MQSKNVYLFNVFSFILGLTVGSVLLLILTTADYEVADFKVLAKKTIAIDRELGSHWTKQDKHRANKSGRLLCWVTTNNGYHSTRAAKIKSTWGRRCDTLLFMSNKNDTALNAIAISPASMDQYNTLWGKTKRSLSYIYKNHLKTHDWFLKADDDTYVIVENLRELLIQQDISKPAYLGCRVKSAGVYYASGGAGYVLNAKAISLFVEGEKFACPSGNMGSEDLNLGACMSALGVEVTDTRDDLGRLRFLPLQPEIILNLDSMLAKEDNYAGWFMRSYGYDHVKPDTESCSDYPVSFHYLPPERLEEMEYLIYKVKVKGQ